MKKNKIIAGLLVLLGFTGCEPDDAQKPMYGPQSPDMYGTPPTRFEQKPRVPDTAETTGTDEFALRETKADNEEE